MVGQVPLRGIDVDTLRSQPTLKSRKVHTDAAIDRISRGEGTPDDYLLLGLSFGTVHDSPFANSTKEDVARIAANLTFDQHASSTMVKRGWTQQMVRGLVANPKRIVRTLRDTRYNPVTQTRNNFPATAYVPLLKPTDPDLDGGIWTMTLSVIQRGGESYYSISAARDAVGAFQRKGTAVVGVEGFRLSETSTEPLMDYIAHWPEVPRQPWDAYVARCAGYCLQVLAEWERDPPHNFMVSLAVDDGAQHDQDVPRQIDTQLRSGGDAMHNPSPL